MGKMGTNQSILKSYHPNELGLSQWRPGGKKNNTVESGYSIQLAVSGEHNEYLETINSGVKPLVTFNHKARLTTIETFKSSAF